MEEKLNALRRAAYNDRRLSDALHAGSVFSACIAAYAVVWLLLTELSVSVEYTVALAAVMAVPFVIVTVVRALINAPRPYEILDFYEVKPKSKKGHSFPSRHAASAFVIAAVVVFHSVWFGALLFALGILLCVCRVILGIHFVRDVLAGALIGLISGIAGMLILRGIF